MIGLDVQTQEDLPLGIVYILETIWSLGNEYPGMANVVSESCWIWNLLLELHWPDTKATLVYYDNVNAVYLSDNPVQHQRTKHIKMDIHFVREKVARGQGRVLHVLSVLKILLMKKKKYKEMTVVSYLWQK